MLTRTQFFFILIPLLAGCASAPLMDTQEVQPELSPGDALKAVLLDPRCAEAVLDLDPQSLSRRDIDALSHCPAPRILNFNGSFAPVSMDEFSAFLMRMGYPESALKSVIDDSHSYGSFGDSARFAGLAAWVYEHDALRPMLIGHSQGGMMVVKILHELAGEFSPRSFLWNPHTKNFEKRTRFLDPFTGEMMPVQSLKLPFASAIATGRAMRVLLGQWNMLGRLRTVPDSAETFIGFTVPGDLIGSDMLGLGSAHLYSASGVSRVRNVYLPGHYNHVNLPKTEPLALDAQTRAWLDAYRPQSERSVEPGEPGILKGNLLLAAELWFEIKKNWCLEVQRLVHAKREPGKRPN